jgi:hypothetical protein
MSDNSRLSYYRQKVRTSVIERLIDGDEFLVTEHADEMAVKKLDNEPVEVCLSIINAYDGGQQHDSWDTAQIIAEHNDEDRDARRAFRNAAAMTVMHRVLDDLDALGIEY